MHLHYEGFVSFHKPVSSPCSLTTLFISIDQKVALSYKNHFRFTILLLIIYACRDHRTGPICKNSCCDYPIIRLEILQHVIWRENRETLSMNGKQNQSYFWVHIEDRQMHNFYRAGNQTHREKSENARWGQEGMRPHLCSEERLCRSPPVEDHSDWCFRIRVS